MSKNKNILSLIGENKGLFIIILIGLFLIELEILSVAVIKSGKNPPWKCWTAADP